MVSAETVDIAGIAEMVDIRGQGALASLAVDNTVVHSSHCTLVSALDSAVVAAVVESVDTNHLTDALNNEHYTYAASHSSLDKPFAAPK